MHQFRGRLNRFGNELDVGVKKREVMMSLDTLGLRRLQVIPVKIFLSQVASES